MPYGRRATAAEVRRTLELSPRGLVRARRRRMLEPAVRRGVATIERAFGPCLVVATVVDDPSADVIHVQGDDEM